MEECHRLVLQKNRTDIIDNMADPMTVNDLLYEKNIFTESMRQDVEAESTKLKQARKILDFVPRRGPTAFGIFYEIMLKSSHGTIADILRPELAGSHPNMEGSGDRGYAIPQEEVDLPEWPSEQAMSAQVKVTPCNVKSDLVKQMWNNANVYSMKKRKRGRCLILSNKTFYGPLEKDKYGVQRCVLDTRHGTEKDIKDLTELFSQLHFTVAVETDLTKEKMQKVLFQESNITEHQTAECFVCIICSHGTREGIYGTDGEILSLEDVTAYFDSAHCRNLEKKPKIFFIQACQGEETDRPTQSPVTESGQDLENVISTLNIGDGGEPHAGTDQMDAVRTNPVQQRVPSKLDMIVACATHPGYVSIRNMHFGSWFLQAVVYIFQKYACEESILDLLTLVNRLVGTGRTSLDNTGPRDVMQASMFKSSLQKKFLFFPGVISDTDAQ